jgi:hypothetical protein
MQRRYLSPRTWYGHATAIPLVGLALVVTAGCGSDEPTATTTTTAAAVVPVIDPGDGGDYHPQLDPADFVAVIDNPYLPLTPGSRWVYEGESDGEREENVVVVTDQTRQIEGITAVVVRDTVKVGGALVEDTYDWFAQDRDGNVWYLGEDSSDFDEDGTLASKEGSWEYGKDGALPGIVMPADPQPGDAYRQEYLQGVAEDMGEVLRIEPERAIDLGSYQDVVVTEDWSPLEPEVIENKWYAPGVGLIHSAHETGPPETSTLVEFTPGG